MAEQAASPKLLWDHGTAYDLFASLYVIHNPGDFGLRPSWAAGIRSRLTNGARELLPPVMMHLGIPVAWLHRLPQPKVARAALDQLERMQPEEILPALAFNPDLPEPCNPILSGVMKRGAWNAEDVTAYLGCAGPAHAKALQHDRTSIERYLDGWTRPAEFGEAYRKGLREYYENFYREEERRILPDIERSLARAQELASRGPVAEVFEELSKGIRNEYFLNQRSLILVPCYWCSPRIMYTALREGEVIVLFGARPPEASLIPGDAVPGHLLLALEALSDPTRLSILRTCARQPMTQAEIARTLRLRPPTISHHLKSLRIAGLIAYIGTSPEETRYGTRLRQLDETCDALKAFLGSR